MEYERFHYSSFSHHEDDWQIFPQFFMCRCFTFGIGSGASSELVEGLAQAGYGTAEFVKEGERMQPKVTIIMEWNFYRVL